MHTALAEEIITPLMFYPNYMNSSIEVGATLSSDAFIAPCLLRLNAGQLVSSVSPSKERIANSRNRQSLKQPRKLVSNTSFPYSFLDS